MQGRLGHGGTRAQAARVALPLLLLFAVFLQALIPQGYMPNVDGAPGGSPIVICTGDGMRMAPPAGDKAPVHRQPHHDVCAFAGHAPVAGPAPILALAPVVFVRRIAPALPEAAAPPGLRRHREQAARAPPRLI